jgi:hypothetical protein
MFHGARSMRFATARVAASTLVIGLATFVTVLPAQVAGAADDVVSTCNGSGPGSLPAVVAAAASGDTITFSVSCPPSSPITLASTLDIDTNLTIDGPGSSDVAVSGDKMVGVFDIASGATVTFSGLTVEDGNSGTDGGGIGNEGSLKVKDSTISGNNAVGLGGGIFSSGTLTVSDSTVSDNASAGTAGGGIYSTGTLTVSNSTVSGNSASGSGASGGGIAVSCTTSSPPPGTATVSDTTVSGNTVPVDGGGICNGSSGSMTLTDSTISGNKAGGNGGGIANDDTLTVSNSTLSGNSDTGGGGAIFTIGGTVTVTSSTLSGNSNEETNYGIIQDNCCAVNLSATVVANSTGADCAGFVSVPVTDDGYNVDDDGSCGFAASNHSLSDMDPDLGPLANNGGPTETLAPELGTPVLDQIPVETTADGFTLCPGTDQRGVSRPQGPECDIGAVELAPISRAIISPNSANATVGSLFSFTVSTSGTPVPTISEKGTLPKKLTFTDNGDGTATISGKPKTPGVYHLTITATFGKGSNKYVVSQAFTLTVNSG